MKHRHLPSLLIAAVTLACAPAFALAQDNAATTAPAAASASKVVLDNSTRLLSTLEARRAEFRANAQALNTFIRSEFDQLFDRNLSARLVLGVHARGASDTDVKLFADALAENLLQRYGTSLLDFDGRPQLRVKSETALPGGRGVRVATELVRANGAPVPVDYLLRNNGGQWKVFDVMIEGISYVQTFKNQFDPVLRQKSISQVATELRAGKMQADAGN